MPAENLLDEPPLHSAFSNQQILKIIDAVAQLLPFQNPLHNFVHNNPIQNFEHLDFYNGCIEAAWRYNGIPFCEIDEYQKKMGSKSQFFFDEALQILKKYLVIDSKNLVKDPRPLEQRADCLPLSFWETHDVPDYERRLQDLILPFISGFMDQGISSWRFVNRDRGLRKSFDSWIQLFPGFSSAWILKLKKLCHELNDDSVEMAILKMLKKWQIDDNSIFEFVSQMLFSFKGWSGMIRRFETQTLSSLVHAVEANVAEWLYILLISHTALHFHLQDTHKKQFVVPSKNKIDSSFSKFKTHMLPILVWHEAYELFLKSSVMDSHFEKIKKNSSHRFPKTSQPPKYQALFCIDDREEGFRRHLESLSPEIETFGAVGFFGIAMIFDGYDKALPTHQCPPVITPKHLVQEVIANPSQDATQSNQSEWLLTIQSKIRNFMGSLSFSVASSLPLSARILSPGFSEKIREITQTRLFPKHKTQIIIDGPNGFSKVEQAQIVVDLLKGAGLKAPFSSEIFIIGHGATSTNNPFRQAYGCGACGGNSGRSNAIAFCLMANDPEVRALLKSNHEYEIPPQSLLIPLFHDTTTDRITPLDQNLNSENVQNFLALCKKAGQKNSLERVTFFKSYTGPLTEEAAFAHVHDRAYDLSQPRPEYGHSRVAMCILGPRHLSKNLNLDRRSFLVSYSPEMDPDGSYLTQVILGSVPVCANISLDYFFSSTAPNTWGAGTKLSLNLNGLIGVMTGSKEDLRIGLAKQMTEIHEPTRIHVVVICKEDHLQKTIQSHARLTQLVLGKWIHLYCLDSETQELRSLS